MLDLLSAARIEGGRYDFVVREVDSLSLLADGATGTARTVIVDPEPVERALAAAQRAAARHGGVEVAVAVDGPRVSFSPVTAEAALIVLGEDANDLGAASRPGSCAAIGGELTPDGDRLDRHAAELAQSMRRSFRTRPPVWHGAQ